MIRALVGLCAAGLSGSVALATPAGGAATVTPSSATVIATCADGGRKQRAYESGRLQGGSLVESAWEAVDRDCAERPHVDQVVRDALAHHVPPAQASEAVKCRSAGFENGALDGLADLAAACSNN